mgnify:CR=1 FL=1
MVDKTHGNNTAGGAGMTAMAYMNRAFYQNKSINAQMERLCSLKNLVTSTTTALSDMPRPSSPNPQRMESMMTKIVDLEKEVDSAVDTLVELKAEIAEMISQVPKETQRKILTARYLEFNSWSEIAESLFLDVRWVQRQHTRALESIENSMKLTEG